MKTRIVHTKMWEDEFFAGLNPTQKLLFIYFITNDNIGLTGIYEVTNRQISFDTGLNSTQIEDCKQIFQRAGKMVFYQNWIKVLNAQKLGGYSGERVGIAINKELTLIPDDIKAKLEELTYSLDRVSGFTDTSINHKLEIINNNRGIVKGENSLSYLENIPLEDFADIEASPSQIKLEAEKAYNWLKAKGTTRKDYKAFLRNWLFKVYKKRQSIVVQAHEELPELTQEQREANIAKMQEMKKRYGLN